MGQKRKQYGASYKFRIALEAAKNERTISQIAGENNSTIVFPLPIDLIKMFTERVAGGGGTSSS